MSISLEDVLSGIDFVEKKQAELDQAAAILARMTLEWARHRAGISEGENWVLESADKRQFIVDSAEVINGKLIVRGYVLRNDGHPCALRRTKTLELK